MATSKQFITRFSLDYKTIPEKKDRFISEINTLFSLQTESNYIKSWEDEFEMISNFILSLPKEQQEENFFKVCSIYIEQRHTPFNPSSPTLFSSSNESFLNFLADKKLNAFTKEIPQNIFKNQIYNLIHNCIIIESLSEAKKFADIFLLPENKHLQKLENLGTLTNVLNGNKKGTLNFLLDNFEGWDNKNVLTQLFQTTPLDDKLLEKIIDKVGIISEHNSDTLNTILKRDIPKIRLVQILNKLYQPSTHNNGIYNFYLENLNSKEFTLEKLQSLDDKFIAAIQTPEYLVKWITSDYTYFMSQYSNLINLKLVEPDVIHTALLQAFEQPNKIKFNIVPTILPTLYKALGSPISFNTPEIHKIITRFYNIPNFGQSLDQELFNNNTIDLNLPLTIDENNKYANLGDCLKEKNSTYYWIDSFRNSTNKKTSFDNLMNIFNDMSSYGGIKFNDETMNEFYKVAKANKTPNEFFNEYFINASFSDNTIKQEFVYKFLQIFEKESPTLVFDLPKENPIFNFYEKHIYTQSNGDISFKNDYRGLLNKLNQFFQYSLSETVNSEGQSLAKYTRSLDLPLNVINPNYEPKTFFNRFFSKPPELQLIKNSTGCSLITSKSDVIVIDKESITNPNLNDKPSYNSLVEQAHLDLKNFQKLMDVHAEKSLNVEVKIRSENILLNNINFLTSIKGAVDDLAFDDMYFLKNNLNKYLIQCLNTYAKSVGRYETLMEPGNALNTKSEEELEKQKEKIDNEALKQIGLLEKELDLVKQHIVSQFNQDLLTDMRVTTRVLENRVEDSLSRSEPDSGNIVKIRKP
jgi:hypothetical protein